MNIPRQILEEIEICWENPYLASYDSVYPKLRLTRDLVDEAAARLMRFAPLIVKLFPETEVTGGVIESPLVRVPALSAALAGRHGAAPQGEALLKCDSDLPIAGSVKARGGIYEVLKHTEEIAVEAGLIGEDYSVAGGGDYSVLAEHRELFSRYTMQVGSTGNLGMSIGIMSAALGYKAIVHMSADAKDWKKQLLRSHGVDVREYDSDYSVAVAEGRRMSDEDTMSYFVDDEHSINLFLGYAVAGRRVHKQLDDMGIAVDRDHPLVVYLPCGVGGAPGGIAFGLKNEFGDNVHCFFVEPVASPCMLIGLASEQGDTVSVFDCGLSGKTQADGLAVGRASGLVCEMMRETLSGVMTVGDSKLFEHMRTLRDSEGIVIEPSACAAIEGYMAMADESRGARYMATLAGTEPTHIMWATGGSLMPEEIVKEYLNYGRR